MATVIYVNRLGTARCDKYPGQEAAEERARVAALLRRATPPDRVSAQIIAAPARLYAIAETPRITVMTENGPRTRRESALPRSDRVRVGDGFDKIEEAARKAHARLCADAKRRKVDPPAWTPPFLEQQIRVGREYSALAERCAGSGVKCSSLEALRAAAGGGGDREAAMLRDFQRLRYFERRIGDGLAKEVRRIRPDGAERHAIRVSVLVNQVCLGWMTLDQVFEAHGWVHVNGRMRYQLLTVMRNALDRMRGFNLVRPQNVA